jgi:hypothetical protein
MEFDLGVLVADEDQHQTFAELLKRHQSLGIRKISFRVIKHSQHDPGCYNKSALLMSTFLGRAQRGLVVFDRDGSNAPGALSVRDIEAEVRRQNVVAGWGESAIECVVIEPELESWVWSPSPHVSTVLGWGDRRDELDAFLQSRSYKTNEHGKWTPPKEAMEEALLRAGKAKRSASYYAQLAEKVSIQRCTDPAFLRLLNILRAWFPPNP